MECEHQFVATTQRRKVTAQGLLGVIGVVAGLICLFANPILGVLIIIASLIIASIGRNKSVLICAKCGERAPVKL